MKKRVFAAGPLGQQRNALLLFILGIVLGLSVGTLQILAEMIYFICVFRFIKRITTVLK
jgi:hypothetical protein